MAEMSLAELGAASPNGVPRIVIYAPSKSQPVDDWAAFPIVSGPQAQSGGGGGDPWAAFPIETEAKPGVVKDVAKSIPSGLASGAASVIGLPDLLDRLAGVLVDQSLGRALTAYRTGGEDWSVAEKTPEQQAVLDEIKKNRVAPFPTTEGTVKAIEGVTGPLYQPQTRAGRYAETAASFIPGTLMARGGSLIGNAVRYGVLPGLASEGAGQLTEGSPYEGAARFAGALAGGAAASLASRPGTAAQAIRSQLPEGVAPNMVQRAGGLIEDAARQGVNLSWPEALSKVAGRPVLTNVMRHLEGAPQTEARMAEYFGARPQQMQTAGRDAIGNISAPNAQPSAIGPQVNQAASGLIDDTRGAINAASKPFYSAAEMQRIDPTTMARVTAAPGWQEASQAVRRDPQLARYVAGMPDDSVGFLNEVKKYLDAAAENASAPVNAVRNMQRSAGYGSDASLVRDAARNASPQYATALDIQSVGRERYLKPLLDGYIGRLAKNDLTTQEAIRVLFPQNPLPNSAGEISQAVSALAKRNPRAASDLVRAHIESTFNEATQALVGGANQAGGAKFVAQLLGNPQQRANVEAAVRALPNGGRRWEGFNRFVQVAEATGTRQNIGSRTAYNDMLFQNQARSGLVGEGAKAVANPLKGFQFVADRFERWKLGRNLDELASIFTDPKKARFLENIAAMPVNSRAARELAIRITGAAAPPIEARGTSR